MATSMPGEPKTCARPVRHPRQPAHAVNKRQAQVVEEELSGSKDRRNYRRGSLPRSEVLVADPRQERGDLRGREYRAADLDVGARVREALQAGERRHRVVADDVQVSADRLEVPASEPGEGAVSDHVQL